MMYSVRMRASEDGRHVSGAETICEAHEVRDEAAAMFLRAADAGRVVVTVERLDDPPVEIPCLAICTPDPEDFGIAAPDNAAYGNAACYAAPPDNGSLAGESAENPSRACACKILRRIGVGRAAITRAWEIIDNVETPGGAALIDINDGGRLDDCAGGLRVTRFAYSKAARTAVDDALGALGLTHFRTREALALASKAAACPGIEAELCASDDPGYTTGYVASKRMGYMRIPGIKPAGSRSGGRVYFAGRGADAGEIIRYLTLSPVLISYTRPPGVPFIGFNVLE
jgi:6-carboxyhexanoate--CoA ligase